MDWLAACQGLDTRLPPVPSALLLCQSVQAPVGCQGGWTLLQEGAVVAWAWGWGSIKVPVALATLASVGTLGRMALEKRQMEGEEAALSLACVCP